jgi:tRNA threonylcarbamoyladenosine biosynthesis protein TsaB
MKLMVVDTSLGLCTVGVFEVDSAGASCLGLRSEPMTKGHSERIAGFAATQRARPRCRSPNSTGSG